MTKAGNDDLSKLVAMMAQKPSGPDWNKLGLTVIGAICVFYVTNSLKNTESASISVPVITEKLDAIKVSIAKLEAQMESSRGDAKGEFNGLESRIRHLELSILKTKPE